MVILDEEFGDLTQFIVSKEEMVGTAEMNHIRLRKMLSGKEFSNQYMKDMILRKIKKLGNVAEGFFVLEAIPSIIDSSDELFVLDIPSFELDMAELVIIESF
ncbi:hypothetical protein ACH5RR_007008 [Cinchona calisaya]|uniref:Uncharacterized protein n=1 Tax=Cinchona calisaya TaxID=153742 RepID=A0ABD3AR06_9GENT